MAYTITLYGVVTAYTVPYILADVGQGRGAQPGVWFGGGWGEAQWRNFL